MINKTRAIALIVGALSIGLLAGCGDGDGDGPSDKVTPPKISTDITLEAEKNGFNKSSVTAEPGTIKITVVNPTDSDSEHGVGIVGGEYKDEVKGAPVKPGRSTSLTVAVKKGTYTIFDSYKNNREKGFETKLTVE